MENANVVILGGGPAGAAFAREFSRNSRKRVVLLEQSRELGKPDKSTSGFVPEEARMLEIPERLWGWNTDVIILEGPGYSIEAPLPMLISDYTAIVAHFLREASDNGVEVRTASHVRGVSDGTVSYSSGEGENMLSAEFIVDASGPASPFARKLRILPYRRLGLGYDARIEGANLENPRQMVFRFDSRFAPGGYSWIFPTGRTTARVGNCFGERIKGNFPNGRLTHKELYELWAKEDGRLSSARIVEESGGIAYCEDARRRVFGNYVAIGDSASTVRPPFGLGIAPAMHSGILAARMLAKNGNLRGFDREMNWIERWKPLINSVSEAFYCLPPQKMERVLRGLTGIRKEDALRFLSLDFSLKKDLPTAWRIARAALF